MGIGITTLTTAVIVYTRINAKRELLEQERLEAGVKYSAKELRALGDRAPDFRYTL